MHIGAISILVPSYEEGIAFFVETLGFDLIEDTPQPGKRWVVVAPSGGGTALVLAQPTTPAQESSMGAQAGDRVGFFLHVSNFAASYEAFLAKGVRFREKPRSEPYGIVAVFEDPWGNAWDLIERR